MNNPIKTLPKITTPTITAPRKDAPIALPPVAGVNRLDRLLRGKSFHLLYRNGTRFRAGLIEELVDQSWALVRYYSLRNWSPGSIWSSSLARTHQWKPWKGSGFTRARMRWKQPTKASWPAICRNRQRMPPIPMSSEEKMPYWTPAGIVMDAAPPAYAAVIATTESQGWDELLAEHGYEKKESIGEQYHLIDVNFWTHKEDGHLMIEHYLAGTDWHVTLFVRAEDLGAWSRDGYLKLVQACAQAEQADAMSRLTKSIIAFIRYGHGEDTINEYGDQSEDDDRCWREQQFRRKSKAS